MYEWMDRWDGQLLLSGSYSPKTQNSAAPRRVLKLYRRPPQPPPRQTLTQDLQIPSPILKALRRHPVSAKDARTSPIPLTIRLTPPPPRILAAQPPPKRPVASHPSPAYPPRGPRSTSHPPEPFRTRASEPRPPPSGSRCPLRTPSPKPASRGRARVAMATGVYFAPGTHSSLRSAPHPPCLRVGVSKGWDGRQCRDGN